MTEPTTSKRVREALGRPPEAIPLRRIQLRRHRPEDAAALFAAVDGDRERLGRFLPWVWALERVEDETRFIGDMTREWEDGTLFDYEIHPRAELSATVPAGPTPAGTIGAHSIVWDRRQCELGYWLHGAWEGKGLIQEAIRGLEGALLDLGFERIEIRCDADNERSAATARRAGYVLEGRLRHHRPRGDGSWADTLIFSRLSTDPPRGPQPAPPALKTGPTQESEAGTARSSGPPEGSGEELGQEPAPGLHLG